MRHTNEERGNTVKPTEHTANTASISKTGLFATLGGFLRVNGSGAPKISQVIGVSTLALGSVLASLGIIAAVLPATAGAYATIAGPSVFSSAPGLPDGRVYEQVSPADKNGNDAGASTDEVAEYGGLAHYALAAPEGNGVLFEGSGPFGETADGYNLYFVAERSATGWKTRGILPRATERQSTKGGTITVQPEHVDPSTDLSHVVFKGSDGLFAPPPYPQCGYAHGGAEQLYLSGPDPFLAATWLERPQISDPIENCAGEFGAASGASVGGTPDFSTVYFTYPGTILPEDASRALHAQGEGERGEFNVEAWGLYEYSAGVLKEAGVLPAGSPNGPLDPFGAVPAASLRGRALVGNQVSADGSRLFFVSPDPNSCGRGNNCAVDPPELYVRENGEETQLVSRDTLLPDVGGLPVAAPDSVSEMPNPNDGNDFGAAHAGSDVFASSDGSQAFFQSEDKLTGDAPEGPPGDVAPKTYDFNVDTGILTYLPGVVGQIVAATPDGSSFAFVNSTASPTELDLWSAGASGGTVTPVMQMPGTGASVARISSDGSALVFMAYGQIFHYDVPTNTLACVSCAPQGVPNGPVEMSPLQANEGNEGGAGLQRYAGLVDERGVSMDDSRVFFDTTAALVPQDTDGTSDVYEWENGTVYLLSSGTSTRPSYFLDNSETGSDVFFATSEGLVPGDTDGAYDVYDARIPHSGDNPPAAAVPCEGSVCQGPPRVPVPLAAPASATFSGLGNIAPAVAAKPASKVKPKAKPKLAQKLASALKACKREPVKQRAGCETRAKKRYGSKTKAKKSNRGGK
jgi:hypothetical protein